MSDKSKWRVVRMSKKSKHCKREYPFKHQLKYVCEGFVKNMKRNFGVDCAVEEIKNE